MNIGRRIQKIEELIKSGKDELVVFSVRSGNEQEDFDRQLSEYIASGGNEDAFFVQVVKFAN